jgi:hypothetical protein
MTTTCTHPCTVVNHQSPAARVWPSFSVWHGLARLGAWASHGVQTRYAHWREADALRNMDLHQLRDVGAPDWLQQQAAARQAQESYEYIKATSQLKY